MNTSTTTTTAPPPLMPATALATNYCGEGGAWVASVWRSLTPTEGQRLRLLAAAYPLGITCRGEPTPALVTLEASGLVEQTRGNHWKIADAGKLVADHGTGASTNGATTP